MGEADFKRSLAVKVDGSVHLAAVFQNEPLDFMLFFSSMMSYSKAPGQSNYAAGCTFKDAFAHYLSHAMPYSVKTINWGYWGDVGIVTDTRYRERMARQGIGSITPEEGIPALTGLLNSPLRQLVVIKQLRPGAVPLLKDDEALTVQNNEAPIDIQRILNSATMFDTSIKDAKNPAGGVQTPELDGLLKALLCAELQHMGAIENHNVLAKRYQRWLKTSLTMTADEIDQSCSHEANNSKRKRLWEQWNEKKNDALNNPDLKAQITLLDACLQALPDILSGQALATDIIFPDSSMDLVAGIY